jgi:hypothetical protein
VAMNVGLHCQSRGGSRSDSSRIAAAAADKNRDRPARLATIGCAVQNVYSIDYSDPPLINCCIGQTALLNSI